MRRLIGQELPPYAVMSVGDLGLDLPGQAPSSIQDLNADELAEAIDTFIRVNQNVVHASFAVNLSKSGELVISHTNEDQAALALVHHLFGPDVRIESVVIDGLVVPAPAIGESQPGRSALIPAAAVVLALLAGTVVLWRRSSHHTL